MDNWRLFRVITDKGWSYLMVVLSPTATDIEVAVLAGKRFVSHNIHYSNLKVQEIKSIAPGIFQGWD